MGKVRDETPATTKPAAKPAAKGGPSSPKAPGVFVAFAMNLLRADRYKPLQGWNARLWTAVGLGGVIAIGIYLLYFEVQSLSTTARLAIPLGAAALLGWFLYRLVNFPPFADFLIATEAEMNKVSWTSRADLRRATIVVLSTVLLMSVFLYGVDQIWVLLLKLLGVLQTDGGGSFGSTA